MASIYCYAVSQTANDTVTLPNSWLLRSTSDAAPTFRPLLDWLGPQS